MADTGATLPGTGQTIDRGHADWANPTNIEAEANAATCTVLKLPGSSDWLRATDFGFAVPGTATIVGIKVEVNREASAAGVISEADIYLLDADGNPVGDDKASVTMWPTDAATATYGGDSDTWAASPTPAMVNDSDFGVQLYVLNVDEGDSRTASVYWVKITVYYTEPPTTTILPATLITPDSARINAEVLSDGGAACEGRFCWGKILQEDDFEWGSDEDPLDDNGGGITWTIEAAGDSKAEICETDPFAGTRCARLHRDGSNTAVAHFAQAALTSDQVIEWRVKKSETSHHAFYHGNGTYRVVVVIRDTEAIEYYDGAYQSTGESVVVNEWNLLSIRNVNWGTQTYDIYLNGDEIKSGAGMQTTATHANKVDLRNSAGTSDVWIDNVRVLANRTTTEFANGLVTDDPFFAALASLSSGARHVYEAQLQNSAGEGLWSDEATFWTIFLLSVSDGLELGDTRLAIATPTAITQAATNIEDTTARINGKISDDGGESCEARFRWRKAEEETSVSTVGTTTLVNSIRIPSQRNSFYAAGRFWVFYAISATNDLIYRTSTDGITWGSAIDVAPLPVPVGANYDVFFDGTYVHYARNIGASAPDYLGIAYRRGTPQSDGTISWSAAEQTALSDSYDANDVSLCVDSNGYPWVGYASEDPKSKVTTSSTNDGTWVTKSGYPYTLDLYGQLYPFLLLQTSGKIAAILHRPKITASVISARFYNGVDTWSNLETVTPSTDDGKVSINTLAMICGTTIDDEVHLVYRSVSNKIQYVHGTSGSWSGITTLADSVSTYTSPVICADGSNLYVFWLSSDNHVYYRKYSDSWEDAVDWIDESTDTFPNTRLIQCFYKSYDGRIGVSYQTEASSPYNVRFALPATVGEWTTTEWQNTLVTDSIFYEDLTELSELTAYEFQTQPKNSEGEGAWSASAYFETICLLSVTEGLIVGASRSQSMTAGLSRTDGLASGDTSNPFGMLSKLDGLKSGDSLSLLAHLLASDGLKIGDTPSYGAFIIWLLSVADGMKLGDSNIRNLILSLAVTDGTKLGDSLSILARLIINDGLEVGDSPSREMIADLLRSDGMNLGDLGTLGEAILYLAIADGLKAGDTGLIEMLADIQASDGLKVGDAPIQSLLASLGIEDGLKLGDTVLAEVDIGGILLSIVEGIKMGDSNSLSNLIELAILEAIKLGDAGVLRGLGRLLRLLILTTQKRKVNVVTSQKRKVRVITGE